jgi:tRNA (mo5U34)-methyltransferase
MSATTASSPSQAPIESRIRALAPWFHNLNLAGIYTAPDHFLGDYPTVKWLRFAHVVPPDLSGRTVLDIGCNAGFYALEMKRRGADRVVAIDSDPRYLAQAQLASEISNLPIELRQLDVYDVGKLQERFDLVIFMGVLYHLRHPLLALDLIYEQVARDLMLFQSLQRGSLAVEEVAPNYDFWEMSHFDQPGYPKMHFVEGRYADDPTNWWLPNRACVEAMLRSSGFSIEERAEQEVYLCRRTERGDHPGAAYPSSGDPP